MKTWTAYSFLATTRRGEALGLHWNDVDLHRGFASIRQQVVALPLPRTSGEATAGLRQWRKQQSTERLQPGAAYEDGGLVHPHPDGRPFHPEIVSKTFRPPAPPRRSHDLRHTWATLVLEAGIDIAVVSSSSATPPEHHQHVRRRMQTKTTARVADAKASGWLQPPGDQPVITWEIPTHLAQKPRSMTWASGLLGGGLELRSGSSREVPPGLAQYP